jgi:hypothetical protein
VASETTPLERLRPVIAVVAAAARVVRVYATVVLVAALVIGAVIVSEGTESTGVTALLLILVAAPPALLFYAYFALRGVAELFERLVRFPDLARRHADDLREAVVEGNVLVREVDPRRRPGMRRTLGLLWRFRALISATRGLVPGYQPLLLFLKPALLVPVAFAAVAGAAEIVLAPIVLLVAALA